MDLNKDAQVVLANETHLQLVGTFFYLTNTVRPDIAYAWNFLSFFMHRPATQLWEAAKHVFRCLNWGLDLGIFFPSGKARKLRPLQLRTGSRTLVLKVGQWPYTIVG